MKLSLSIFFLWTGIVIGNLWQFDVIKTIEQPGWDRTIFDSSPLDADHSLFTVCGIAV